MPAGDGTGPAGFGPGSGRGMGYCNGFDRPGYMNRSGHHLYGGYGAGRGRGRGFRRRVYPGVNPYSSQVQQGQASPRPNFDQVKQGSEVNFLRNRAKQLEDELKAIDDRLDELTDSKDNEDK